MDITIDLLIEMLESQDMTTEERTFLIKNIRHIEKAFKERYKKDVIFTL
jgi:hypothetical protein